MYILFNETDIHITRYDRDMNRMYKHEVNMNDKCLTVFRTPKNSVHKQKTLMYEQNLRDNSTEILPIGKICRPLISPEMSAEFAAIRDHDVNGLADYINNDNVLKRLNEIIAILDAITTEITALKDYKIKPCNSDCTGYRFSINTNKRTLSFDDIPCVNLCTKNKLVINICNVVSIDATPITCIGNTNITFDNYEIDLGYLYSVFCDIYITVCGILDTHIMTSKFTKSMT